MTEAAPSPDCTCSFGQNPEPDYDCAVHFSGRADPSLLQERDRLTPHERQTLAQHREDGNGGCIVCREWIIGTHDDDTEHVIMAWPCPVVRLAATPTAEEPTDD